MLVKKPSRAESADAFFMLQERENRPSPSRESMLLRPRPSPALRFKAPPFFPPLSLPGRTTFIN